MSHVLAKELAVSVSPITDGWANYPRAIFPITLNELMTEASNVSSVPKASQNEWIRGDYALTNLGSLQK